MSATLHDLLTTGDMRQIRQIFATRCPEFTALTRLDYHRGQWSREVIAFILDYIEQVYPDLVFDRRTMFFCFVVLNPHSDIADYIHQRYGDSLLKNYDIIDDYVTSGTPMDADLLDDIIARGFGAVVDDHVALAIQRGDPAFYKYALERMRLADHR